MTAPTTVKPKAPEDTIAAISTPPGEGGIGIVRLSGRAAIDVAHAMFRSSTGRDIRRDRGPVFHGVIADARGVLDEVLLHVMRAPHSYTAEDVVEINCHGGAGPLTAVLALALEHGARLAEPGEFTKRAFLNGRIDLAQAESVIDLIRARTDAAVRSAAAAGQGALSHAIRELREVLLDALARVESAVDFPEEDLPELVDAALRARLEDARARIGELLATAEVGRLLREGASIAIAGRPNVGKSSLFNALLRDARAIVTAQPGTTRDLLEESINLGGVPARLADTAGLRATDDEVERIGVERARQAVKTADIVMLVVDASMPSIPEDEALATDLAAENTPVVLVVNKIDLAPPPPPPAWAGNCRGAVFVSAKTGEGLKELEALLAQLLLGGASLSPEQPLVTRVHQRDSLRRASAALDRLLANYDASPEFLSIDLRDALDALGEITGETTTEDVLDRIFSSFCIGK